MRVMLKFQDLLRANTAKLAEMITREHGKTRPTPRAKSAAA